MNRREILKQSAAAIATLAGSCRITEAAGQRSAVFIELLIPLRDEQHAHVRKTIEEMLRPLGIVPVIYPTGMMRVSAVREGQ